jgi:hypothetical protein
MSCSWKTPYAAAAIACGARRKLVVVRDATVAVNHSPDKAVTAGQACGLANIYVWPYYVYRDVCQSLNTHCIAS